MSAERLRRLLPGDLDPAQRALYEAIAAGERSRGGQAFDIVEPDGALTGPYGLMVHAPEIGAPLQELGAALRFRSVFDDRVREIVILMVARGPGSRFAWWAHERIALTVGVSAEEIEAIEAGEFTGRDDVERRICDVVERLLDGGSVDDAGFERAASVLSSRELVELSVLVGYYRTLTQAMTLFEVGIPGPDA